MQVITLIGNLGQDAEIKEVNNNKFAAFSVGCTIRKKNGDKVEEKTTWYDCSTNNLKVAEFLKKGTKIYLQGRFKLDTYWSEKLNKWVPKINIFSTDIELLSAKKEEGTATEKTGTQATTESGGNGGDDLPF
ncbi:single-stranded DNA-binding protein [Emticicia sp. 17c]|uniref:single-stranded DNA-binding protein n=1 Tax=Emticicia sp. 17c TaxID=3127704 RepID=UPI00301DF9A1